MTLSRGVKDFLPHYVRKKFDPPLSLLEKVWPLLFQDPTTSIVTTLLDHCLYSEGSRRKVNFRESFF